MCTSNEMSVTTNSIITASPSTWVPTPNLTAPLCHHVDVVDHRLDGRVLAGVEALPERRSSPCSAVRVVDAGSTDRVTHESTNDAPTARIPISAPFLGRRLPKNRISEERHRGDRRDDPGLVEHRPVSPSAGRPRRGRDCGGCGR